VEDRRWAAKINNFILTFNFCHPKENREKKRRSERYFSRFTVYEHGKYLLTTEFRFNAMLCFIPGNENSDAGTQDVRMRRRIPTLALHQ